MAKKKQQRGRLQPGDGDEFGEQHGDGADPGVLEQLESGALLDELGKSPASCCKGPPSCDQCGCAAMPMF